VETILLKEIDTLPSILTMDSIKNLPYLTACIDESLRLYPPVPNDSKEALQDDVLPNGYRVKKGDFIIWSAYLMGRLEEYWDKPLEFLPERWFGDNGGKKNPIHNQPPFMPFQIGPRICLGINMAYLEIKILTCLILQKYQLLLAPKHVVKGITSLTLNTKYGMKMIITKRIFSNKL